MNKTKRSTVTALTECAIMIALSTVLSIFKIFRMFGFVSIKLIQCIEYHLLNTDTTVKFFH